MNPEALTQNQNIMATPVEPTKPSRNQRRLMARNRRKQFNPNTLVKRNEALGNLAAIMAEKVDAMAGQMDLTDTPEGVELCNLARAILNGAGLPVQNIPEPLEKAVGE